MAFLQKFFPAIYWCPAINSFFCFVKLSYLSLSIVTITFQTPVKLKVSQLNKILGACFDNESKNWVNPRRESDGCVAESERKLNPCA